MRADALAHLAVPSVPAPTWRVAIVRAPGRVSRVVAADVAHQLRRSGSVVVECDAGRRAVEELGVPRPALEGSPDVVIQVGARVPAAVRLAAELAVPLLELDQALPSPLPDALRDALAGEADGAAPLLEVSLGGIGMLTSRPVHVRQGCVLAYTTGCDEPRRIPADDLRVAVSASGTVLQLERSSSGEPTTATLVEIDGDAPVQLIVDGAERAACRVVLRPHPLRLRILDTGRVA